MLISKSLLNQIIEEIRIAPKNHKIYNHYRYRFLSIHEGIYHKAYKDVFSNTTIGIGFNMDNKLSEQQWQTAFLNQNPDKKFHQYKSYGLCLTIMEVNTLFSYCIQKRQKELKILYSNIWDLMSPNIQMAIEDLYYQSPKLVNQNTRFFQAICNYIYTSEMHFLNSAIEEIISFSNPHKIPGIQKRRQAEAHLLSAG